jgi:hypothetical protein
MSTYFPLSGNFIMRYSKNKAFTIPVIKPILCIFVLCFLSGCQTGRDQSSNECVSLVGDNSDILFDSISISNDDCSEEQCIESLKTLKYLIMNKSTAVEASQSFIPVTITAKNIQLNDYLTILSHHFNLKFKVEKQKSDVVITILDITKH